MILQSTHFGLLGATQVYSQRALPAIRCGTTRGRARQVIQHEIWK